MEPSNAGNLSPLTVVQRMWLNWAVTIGVPTSLCVVSLWVAPSWLALLTFAGALMMTAMRRYDMMRRRPECNIALHIGARMMLTSSIIMVALILMRDYGIYDMLFGYDPFGLPFVPILVYAPTLLVFSSYAAIRGARYPFCVDCRNRNGSPAEQGYIGTIYLQEGTYQVRFMVRLSGFVTAVNYAYYFFFYVNVNLNSPDRFFYVWLPVILYLCSLVYMASRYMTLWMYYASDGIKGNVDTRLVTRVRFLITSHDLLWMDNGAHDVVGSDTVQRLDTPASLTMPRRAEMSLDEAREMFRRLSGIDTFELRFMYVNDTVSRDSNIFHFIAVVPEPEQMQQSTLAGRWYNLGELRRLVNNQELTPLLASEIHRLYTIAMAWKTYDRRGNRLYKIKNYRPTFRLDGILTWDVDFNDPHWLYVARNNEDRPFFRTRRLWNGIFSADR